MINVKIDRLNIRLKAISPQIIDGLVNGIGDELLDEIARQPLAGNKNINHIKIDRLDLGVITPERNSSSSNLQKLIVNQIGESLQRLTGKEGYQNESAHEF